MSLLNPPVVAFILFSITFAVAGMLSPVFTGIRKTFYRSMGDLELAGVDKRLLRGVRKRALRWHFKGVVPLFLLQAGLVVRIISQNAQGCPDMADGIVVCVLDPLILVGCLFLHAWFWIAQIPIGSLAGSAGGAAAVLVEPTIRRLSRGTGQEQPPEGGP